MPCQFDDGKEAEALRTIGEVGEGLGIKPHVLRYWEQQFPQLRPAKRSGGRRYYRARDIALIEVINRLVNREGYTLKGARDVLRTRGASEIEAAAEGGKSAAVPGETQILPQLKAIRARLAAAIGS